MSSLFGATENGQSLTESIFGPSSAASSNSNLFTQSAHSTPRPKKHKRPRTKAPSSSGSESAAVTHHEGGEKGGVKNELLSRDETLRRRRQQSEDKSLEQLTISLKDYGRDGGGNIEELYADVRGLMKHHGLVILRDALSEGNVAEITDLADSTRRRICETLDARKIPYDSPINDTETVCFRELAVRCRGRMDVRYEEDYGNDDDTKTTSATTAKRTDTDNTTPKKLPPLSLIDNLAASVLHGAEAPNLVYSGWIFSFPDSADQPWHQDGSPLFERGTESLPSYALNVFCGLHHRRELLELGPTEFVVGSHRMEAEGAMDEIGTAVSAVLGKGDILLYDYRICHRGTSNLSSSVDASARDDRGESNDDSGVVRKVLYLMYARPWFREHLNFGDKSLFE